eukprot:maker-scaffold_38-snap-gene-1.18-mRNA-1 protein AED:0.01 eAED:0.01 QI:59/1/1/1/1/1/3/608/234
MSTPSCTVSLVGNGICEPECQVREFNFDFPDCCNISDCKTHLVSNTECNDECNILECAFDGGDCFENSECKAFPETCAPEDLVNLPVCTLSTVNKCSLTMIGDDVCDASCYTGDCMLDGNDCDDDPSAIMILVFGSIFATLFLLSIAVYATFYFIRRSIELDQQDEEKQKRDYIFPYLQQQEKNTETTFTGTTTKMSLGFFQADGSFYTRKENGFEMASDRLGQSLRLRSRRGF